MDRKAISRSCSLGQQALGLGGIRGARTKRERRLVFSRWRKLARTAGKPRHAASVFVYADALWMVAGNNMESDIWKLVRTR